MLSTNKKELAVKQWLCFIASNLIYFVLTTSLDGIFLDLISCCFVQQHTVQACSLGAAVVYTLSVW